MVTLEARSELGLGHAEILVLHLELDAMHFEFVHELLDVSWGRDLALWSRYRGCTATSEQCFGASP
jgi:hypothetical protein